MRTHRTRERERERYPYTFVLPNPFRGAQSGAQGSSDLHDGAVGLARITGVHDRAGRERAGRGLGKGQGNAQNGRVAGCDGERTGAHDDAHVIRVGAWQVTDRVVGVVWTEGVSSAENEPAVRLAYGTRRPVYG